MFYLYNTGTYRTQNTVEWQASIAQLNFESYISVNTEYCDEEITAKLGVNTFWEALLTNAKYSTPIN